MCSRDAIQATCLYFTIFFRLVVRGLGQVSGSDIFFEIFIDFQTEWTIFRQATATLISIYILKSIFTELLTHTLKIVNDIPHICTNLHVVMDICKYMVATYIRIHIYIYIYVFVTF